MRTPAPQHDRREVQLQLVDQASVQGPLHRDCPTGDTPVLAPGGGLSLLNGAGDDVDISRLNLALCGPAFPQVTGESQRPRDAVLREAPIRMGAGSGSAMP
jgi:hypothetical protein